MSKQPELFHILHHQTGEIVATMDNTDGHIFDNAIHYQVLEGENRFDVDIYAQQEVAQHLQGKFRLLIPGDEGDWMEFIAFRPEIEEDWIYITSVGAEVNHDREGVITPITSDVGNNAYDYALKAETRHHKMGEIAETGFRNIKITDHVGPRTYLKKIAQEFGLLLKYRVITDEHGIVARVFDLIENKAPESGRVLEPDSGLLKLRKSVDSHGIVTALFCIGPEREDGTRYTVTVDNQEALENWGWQGEHLIEIYYPETDDTEMTLERLTELGNIELNKRMAAHFEYEVEAQVVDTMFPGQQAKLGYQIGVVNRRFNPPIYAEARIIGVKRNINDAKFKTYTVGEVKEKTQAEAMKTFFQLQHLYGVKILKSDTKPPGQPKTIWINTASPLKTPHTFNFEINDWEKIAPTSAEEIGGLVVGKQYNGVTVTPEDGLKVDRTDGLVETFVNATYGFRITARSSTGDPFQLVFGADENGHLVYTGIAKGNEIILGGEEGGSVTILDSNGIPIVRLDENVRDMPDLTVGHLYAPNKVEYIDYGDTPFVQCVAAEAMSGVSEPSDENDGLSWSQPLRTISEALRRIPRMFDGVAEIALAYGQTYDEEIIIGGYSGRGTIIIRNSADTTRATITGKVEVTNNTVFLEWRDLNLNSTDPYAGFFLRGSVGKIINCRINGAVGDTTFGINVNSGAHYEIIGCSFYNITTAVRASYGGSAYVSEANGSVSGVALQAFGGGVVSGSGSAPTGGTGNTAQIAGGMVTGTWNFPTPPAPPAPVTQTTKKSWPSTSGSGTWRSDFNYWDAGNYYGNYVTQGSYGGYGPFTGAWFFSNIPGSVTGKKIKSIRIQVSRVAGGTNAAVSVGFRPHTSASRPSGNISLQNTVYNVGIKVGESKWISLPSRFFAGFESGLYKGIGISGSAYAKMSKLAKIEITYEG